MLEDVTIDKRKARKWFLEELDAIFNFRAGKDSFQILNILNVSGIELLETFAVFVG
nr:hypothetical protein [Candidatus Sigynarchaeum springense]